MERLVVRQWGSIEGIVMQFQPATFTLPDDAVSAGMADAANHAFVERELRHEAFTQRLDFLAGIPDLVHADAVDGVAPEGTDFSLAAGDRAKGRHHPAIIALQLQIDVQVAGIEFGHEVCDRDTDCSVDDGCLAE
jgi:hypothetical protein